MLHSEKKHIGLWLYIKQWCFEWISIFFSNFQEVGRIIRKVKADKLIAYQCRLETGK